jgi:hypothetical protein
MNGGGVDGDGMNGDGSTQLLQSQHMCRMCFVASFCMSGAGSLELILVSTLSFGRGAVTISLEVSRTIQEDRMEVVRGRERNMRR